MNAATAYHEAGHAVADWKFGFTVKIASIVPDSKNGSAGHVSSRTRLHFRSLEYSTPSGARIGKIHEQIVSLLAGHAAQKRYNARSVRSYHAQNDREAAANLLFSLHAANELPHVIRYLEKKAGNLIASNWFVIDYLAKELLKRKTMSGQEVEDEILHGFKKEFDRKKARK
jgi:ATP-dependent Zn protease